MAPMYRNKNTGDEFDSGKKPSRRLEHLDNWERLADPEPAEEKIPDGDPKDSWTVAQLTAWAGKNGVDVPAGPKPAVVDAVLAAHAAMQAPPAPPADPATPTADPASTPPVE